MSAACGLPMNPVRYLNLNGDSGVTYYAIGDDFIAVQFQDEAVYIYDHARPGAHHVGQMKIRAVAGRGLATYISQNVKDVYARKQHSWSM